jgi:hypothetical protein
MRLLTYSVRKVELVLLLISAIVIGRMLQRLTELYCWGLARVMVPLRVYSIWILAITLALPVLLSVLVWYISLNY